MREKFNPFIKFAATRTVPSSGTKSTGLTRCCHGFCIAICQFLYREQFAPLIGTQSSGPFYRDSQLIATYRDCAKTHANPDTDGNSNLPAGRYRAFHTSKFPIKIACYQ
jgi:hypothetical protein